jgi:fimbrial isopeptide formation D2 family protein/LPXTG-motif cell wall-anchored protein
MVLALMMVMAMASVAFAEDPAYSITINNTNDNSSINGKQYKAYKVFDLTLGAPDTTKDPVEYGAYSYSIKNSDWAWNTLTTGATTDATTKVITTTYGITLTPSASDPTTYMVDGKTMTAANARALADALATVLPASADGTGTGASEKATISLTKPGYYAVYGVVIPNDPKAEPAEEVVAALALTTTDPSAEVFPKAEVPPLNKKITGQHVLDDAGKAATAEVGKTVSFELDSKVPDLTGYTAYTFKISDTMTSGLTFTDPDGDATNDVVVKINNVDKTSDVTVAVSGQTLTVTIPYDVLKAATKGQDIVVTYSAVVNSNALTTDYEKNTANLEYSNNPTTNSTNKTPDKEVYVIDVDINVDKVANSGTGAKLKDAKFLVFKGATQPADTAEAWYKWDATNNKVTWVAKASADEFVTGTDGKFTPNVRGLEAEATGTKYGLLETVAPAGYNLLDKPVIVTLKTTYTESASAKTATVSAEDATVTNGTVTLSADPNNNQPLATAQVINNSGTELPSTGGIGTTIFYIAGIVMVLGAAAIVIARRKAEQE